ncbi:MAG: hypothetical protein QG553_418 [Patescibacteria group bacterium]|nr:hypothetical protein [Patescibacteria group bacterium]
MAEIADTFGAELIAATRSYMGQPAVHHYEFAGNCLEQASPRCLDDGFGPENFDCSGLIIRAVSDVLGKRVEDWPLDLRHVRDMWGDSQVEATAFEPAPVERGSLLVMRRKHTVDDMTYVVPGHIGVVTQVFRSGAYYIHANAPEGKVIESRLMTFSGVYGTIRPTA